METILHLIQLPVCLSWWLFILMLTPIQKQVGWVRKWKSFDLKCLRECDFYTFLVRIKFNQNHVANEIVARKHCRATYQNSFVSYVPLSKMSQFAVAWLLLVVVLFLLLSCVCESVFSLMRLKCRHITQVNSIWSTHHHTKCWRKMEEKERKRKRSRTNVSERKLKRGHTKTVTAIVPFQYL